MIVYYLKIGACLCSLLMITTVKGEQHPATADEGPLSEIQTAVGLEVALPCDLMPGTMIADKVQLVIWYRQGSVKPIYTFDARGRALQQAIPWADEAVLRKKAHFHYDSNPPELRIKNIQTTDGGLYKCRVDFHKSPTRNWRINVTVLVPPTQLTILDHHGAAVRDQMAGPYMEGAAVNLTCLSSGGSPVPRVSWWKEHALVDDSFQVLPDGTVRNVLHLKSVGRRDLLTVYTCQASNGHVVAALSRKVKLDMTLPPLSLLLQGLNQAIVAGTSTHVTCTAVGARPPPQILWSKGGQVLHGATQSISSDSNTTISELVIIPLPEDNGRQVVCSISLNPSTKSQHLPEGHSTVTTTMGNGNTGFYLKDSSNLNVTHAPIVSLKLGAPLDPKNLMKGSDVYLECDVKANPSITRLEWYHNNKQLHSSRGLIISNQTLVLQGIPKSSRGLYFCRATNMQGSVSSNEVYVDVKYSPLCISESTVIRAALRETINITCQVDSNPLDNLIYKWHFNNSLETFVELPVPTAATALPPSPLLQRPDSRRSILGLSPDVGFSGTQFHRRKRKHAQSQQFLDGRWTTSDSDSEDRTWPYKRFEDDDKINFAEINSMKSLDEGLPEGLLNVFRNVGEFGIAPADQPYTQMFLSNVYKDNQLEGKLRRHKAYTKPIELEQQQLFVRNGDAAIVGNRSSVSSGLHANQFQLQERNHLQQQQKMLHNRESGDHGVLVTSTMTTASPLTNVYTYHIETYDSFGAISCVASNVMGQSQPCWYHIQPADLPDPVKNCSAYNATANSIQIKCIPGHDGGIQQYFHVQIYDEINRQILYNHSYKYADFSINRLPSDSILTIFVTPVNAQGPSKEVCRLRARTLSAPLLRTASSTAVLVQLTPLLGALVGVIATLVLVTICIVVFIKFRSKRIERQNGETHTTNEADKGSAEPLSRNMGSHSSLEEKNPDVVPQKANNEDDFQLQGKAFRCLNMDSQRILYKPATKRENSSALTPACPLSQNFVKQYGELSLTTNPAFSLYNTPQRAPATQRPVYNPPPPLLSTRTSPNIYTRIPGRSYLSANETSMAPISAYDCTTSCTMPLLSGGQSNGSLQSNCSSAGRRGIVGSGGIDICNTIISGSNTLPLHPSGTTIGISSALTSSMTSGNITIGATQSLLTSPVAQATTSATTYSIASAQTPSLSRSMFGTGSVTDETISP